MKIYEVVDDRNRKEYFTSFEKALKAIESKGTIETIKIYANGEYWKAIWIDAEYETPVTWAQALLKRDFNKHYLVKGDCYVINQIEVK